MSGKYIITGEDVNKILAHSPFALSDSPYKKGMGAGQIKKYFYDFITVLAEKLNIHLNDFESDVNQAISDLEVSMTENKTENESQLNKAIEHTVTDILAKLGEHEVGENTHADIRTYISDIETVLDDALLEITRSKNLAQNAYDLAAGKSKVHVVKDFRDMFGMFQYVETNVGDFVLATDKNCPDFVIVDSSYKAIAVKISSEDVKTGNLEAPTVGELYYYEFEQSDAVKEKVVLAIEGGVDLYKYATIEELQIIANGLGSVLEGKQDKLTFDKTPTKDSENPLTSGGVYDAIQSVSPSKTYTLIETRESLVENKGEIEFTDIDLKEFYIEMQAGINNTSANFYAMVNEKYVLMNAKIGLATDTSRGSVFSFYMDTNGFGVALVSDSNEGTPFHPQAPTKMEVRIPPNYMINENGENDYFPIKKIKIFPYGTENEWVKGSTFKLWGVENNEN